MPPKADPRKALKVLGGVAIALAILVIVAAIVVFWLLGSLEGECLFCD